MCIDVPDVTKHFNVTCQIIKYFIFHMSFMSKALEIGIYALQCSLYHPNATCNCEFDGSDGIITVNRYPIGRIWSIVVQAWLVYWLNL